MSVVINLSKSSVEMNLCVLVDKLFSLPEIECIKIRKLEIRKNNKNEMIKSAVKECYHDIYSDIDLCVVIKLSLESEVSPDEYVKHIEHWGFPKGRFWAYALSLKTVCTELYAKMG